MLSLFRELDRESNRSLNIPSSSPLAPHQDPFQNHDQNQLQGTRASHLFRRENIMINGKRKSIRRVFVSHPDFFDYRHIGWVLYCDIHSCMICSKDFMRIIGKRQKHHCKICGNIVCKNCLTGMVRIKEIPSSGYVQACSNCFWGQDEISITPRDDHPVSSPPSPSTSLPPTSLQLHAPKEVSEVCDFYTHLDIEEYDGPCSQGPGTLPPFPPRLDSLCYSDAPSRWSESGSLIGELIPLSPPEHLGTATATIRSQRADSEEMNSDNEEIEDEEMIGSEGDDLVEPPLSEQTGNQAQLMLLLMTLSLSNPSQLTEDEARVHNEQVDLGAMERLGEEEDESGESVRCGE
jgi:hypothetical protein